jgi:hypothetical protein
MSDENFDPWRLLAADLGVDASKTPAPPLPPPAPAPTSQSRGPATSSSAPPPAPKTPSNWLALAGELGIELPAEANEPIKRHDPVAELLGFPAPAPKPVARPEEQQRGERARHERGRGRYEDRDSKRDDWDDRDKDDLDKASDERDLERTDVVQSESTEEGDESPKKEGDRDADGRPRRRRRRGGRGRGRGRGRREETGTRNDQSRDDRNVRNRSDRPSGDQSESARPVESESDEDPWREEPEGQPELPHAGMTPDELRDAQEHAFAEAVEEMEQRGERFVPGTTPDPDPNKRRRRRGRRGRGSRDRNEPRGAPRAERSPATRPIADDADEDSEVHRGYADGMADFSEGDEPERDTVDLDAGVNGEDDLHHGDELHSKSSVRDIVTWKEAIGMIITGNMEARSRNPESSRGSHGGGRGSRGGRGRGRGRGGHRGG